MTISYDEFVKAKTCMTSGYGFECDLSEINPICKDHQKAVIQWAVRGGRRALFESFGLGKTIQQLEIVRLVLKKLNSLIGRALIVAPLGVRQEFKRDAALLGINITFIRSNEEAEKAGIYLTNYESVRDGKLDPKQFDVISLDEAGVLRGFGGTKTFREFMRHFEGSGKYRFVATATPSPNEFIELLAYAAFLDIMDVAGAKTRFFKRDSTKADTLTIHPHKEQEFWLWCASWAIFLQKPSDLGFSDEGYELPPIEVNWHEIPSDHKDAGVEKNGQRRLLANAAIGVSTAAKEKRSSLKARIKRLMLIREASPKTHRIIWHDLETEREALEVAIPNLKTVYGAQDLDEREQYIIDFADGKFPEIGGKPCMLGQGVNFQRHCNEAVFLGIGWKFNDFIQAVHRIQRFGQKKKCTIHLIYTEAERQIRHDLERKWAQHKQLVENMTRIIREYGLASAALSQALSRSIGVERVEASGQNWKLVNNDSVYETERMEQNSVDLILTSIPFSTQYEYSPSYNDFGHTDDVAHFWRQMDYLSPNLLKVLRPGRVFACHVKDRVTPGGLTGLGFQTVQPFHADAITHYTKHGFAYLGMKTIVTDVVRENAQTYRLGWTEQCKDGSRMGVGMPEYLLLFRKPPTDSSNGYADNPVVKSKADYSRARWQFDAHGFSRSSGNRLLRPGDLAGATHAEIFKLFKKHSLEDSYNFEHDVSLAEHLDKIGMLPPSFMLLQPQSWHPDVWTDVTRMRTLNLIQQQKSKEMHLCLARGTSILTRKGFKPIETVVAGDQVLTHRGRWRKVLIARNNGVRPVVRLHAHGVPGLTLTPDHKLWTRKVRDIPWARNHSRKDAEMNEPTWIPAAKTVGFYLNQKLPPVDQKAFKQELLHWWIVGRWIADGHWEKRGAAIISCGKHECVTLRNTLGAHCGGCYETGTAIQIRILDPRGIIKAILKRCGRGAENKTFPPEAFALDPLCARVLLEGYLSGDGHFIRKRERWNVMTISKHLALGVSMLAQRAYGAVATICHGRAARAIKIQGRSVSARGEWIVSFDIPDVNRQKGFPFILEDGAWKRVRRIEDAGKAEVWCLKVEEDESFTAEGCIVKNCPMQFDTADRCIAQFTMKGETVFDPFSGLGTVALRAMMLGRFGLGCELSPSYHADACWHMRAGQAKLNSPTLFELEECLESEVPA